MTAGGNERATAARLLEQVLLHRRTTDQVLGSSPVSSFVQEMLLGSLRHYFSLAALVDGALREPLRRKDQDLRCLMIVGAYQLHHMRVPRHAAVFETVAAVRALGKPWARGLINAVLRRCTESAPDRSFDHPEWLRSALEAQYPNAAEVMRANNARAPMALRVNRVRIAPEEYRQRLEEAGLAARAPADTATAGLGPGPETLVLAEPVPAAALPGFAAGLVAVQDAGAQFAAPLVEAACGSGPVRLLDACAAPGGKLFHLLERLPAIDATALEVQQQRLERLRREAERLGHQRLAAVAGDACSLDWWDGGFYQAVLVDAPCSGTGTLRRHPDIKVLRRRQDLQYLTDLQGRLLANLWQVLEPGGTLLYCTCSILAEENDDVIAHFLSQQIDALAETPALSTGRATRHGWQLLPTDPDTDGFYYACLTRRAGLTSRAGLTRRTEAAGASGGSAGGHHR